MREIMTSRERVWEAINHRQPDRTPIDIGGVPPANIEAMVDAAMEFGRS